MDTKQIEDFLKSLLKGEYSSLTLTYNDHLNNYTDAREASERGDFDREDWPSAEDKEKALTENTVWDLHWYPNTPVGFSNVKASSLAGVLELAGKFL
jgi:hypothetical protein